MAGEVLWTADNLDEAMLPSRQALCAVDNGVLLTHKKPDGRYSAVCHRPATLAAAPIAAPAPAAAVPPAVTPAPVAAPVAAPVVSAAPAMTAPTVAPAFSVAAPASPVGVVAPPPLAAPMMEPAPAPMVAPAPMAAVNVNARDTDLKKLHPMVRKGVKAIQKALDDEKIPMRVFEAYRAPERQAHLYAQGRSRSGAKVTNADAWESYHQFGMAADFVRFENGRWNWNDRTAKEKADWVRFHEIARANGLEPLSWERPHVQGIGVSLTRLRNGDYPEGGDEAWSTHLAEVAARWPGAPPPPDVALRPAMPRGRGTGLAAPPAAPPQGAPVWRSMFGGDAWAVDARGVYTRDANGALKRWRTPGAPITAQEVVARHGDAIEAAAAKHGVAPALIVMTIATETGRWRAEGFTGPSTFRWEQGYTVNATGDAALDGREKGDYSAGPMQVMADTARWMNEVKNLGYDAATTFRFYKNKPTKPPASLGLYDGAVAIDVGAAYLSHQAAKTDGDPLLTAAAYNAGGLYPSSGNRWRLRSHGNHIDRAAEWYGDACFVLGA